MASLMALLGGGPAGGPQAGTPAGLPGDMAGAMGPAPTPPVGGPPMAGGDLKPPATLDTIDAKLDMLMASLQQYWQALSGGGMGPGGGMSGMGGPGGY